MFLQIYLSRIKTVQSAGAVEYTNYTPAEG